MPAAAAAQSARHGHSTQRGRARRAQHRAQIHHRLREIAGPLLRHQRRGEGAQPRLGRAAAACARRTAAPRPARHCRRPPRPAGRRRSPRSPPRCSRRSRAARAAPPGRPGNAPPCARDDGPRAGVQVAGAGVIAEPLPGMQHLVERGRGQRANIGKARHELVKIGADRRDRRLLQHDLAEPDAVGIGRAGRARRARAGRGGGGRTRRAAPRDRGGAARQRTRVGSDWRA